MNKLKDMKSIISNLKYYTDELEKAIKEQFNHDMSLPEINAAVGSTRFDCFGAMLGNCTWLRVYYSGIETNLNQVEKLDKELLTEEKEIGI